MAPSTPAADPDNSHQLLLDQLDIANQPKPFRSSTWKPNQRRNKNIKQILTETSRKEASVFASQNASGSTTPLPASGTDGASTPAGSGAQRPPSFAQAMKSLSTLVLEKNLRATGGGAALGGVGPAVTYTNIESAPSLHPGGKRHYCDVTGLPAKYTDPKTRLRYHNKEIFGYIRTLPPGVAEKHLEARGAHVVLK